MALMTVTPEFRALLAGDDGSVELARAALHVARIEYPGLAVDGCLERIEAMTTVIASRVSPDASVQDALRAINRHLFGELRFSGNLQDYYDPRNSYLNDVLERRLGIPITLSIIYLEVGWRLGLPLAGVSFPGHFLVKLPTDDGAIVIDAYAGGASLGQEELEERLIGLQPAGQPAAPVDVIRYLKAASRKEILHRMLRNLKAIHASRGDDDKLLAVLEHMLCVQPVDWETVRDRGLVCARLGCFGLAVEDLRSYAAARPDAEDLDEVRSRLLEAERAVRNVH